MVESQFSSNSRAAVAAKHALGGLLRAILLIGLNIGISGLFANPAVAKEEARTIAVGSFFAPEGNDGLRQISATMPDLLTVELSQQDGFHLVEREKVTAIWKELNLSASGMVTADTVAKLGHVLACDWLITGTLVPSNTRTQVWAKVVDVKSGVVVDLQALPFDGGNLPATIQGIAAFIAKAKSHRQTDRFITLGRFTDLSADNSHEDWSRRVHALIEQHCRDAHMGLVEREAIAPIFEEFQFDRTGLTGSVTNGVKLQAAFWIVDGACKWVHDTEDKVNVTLRLQKVGGQAQIIEITKAPGPELENTVLAALQPVLAPTAEMTSDQLGLDEGQLHANRGMEAAENNDRFSRYHYNLSTQTDPSRADPQRKRDLEENRQSAIESFEKAFLLNPKDVRAKYMLGYALMGDHDPAQRERAKELLKEVVALNDPNFSKQAGFYLAHAEIFDQKPLVVDARTAPRMSEADRAKLQKRVVEEFEKAFQVNPTNVQAKYNLGFTLVGNEDVAQRERGKKLLKEVVASNDPAFSKRAASVLGYADQLVPKPTAVSTRMSPLPVRPPAAESEATKIEKRVEFLQQNFAKFVPMEFQKSTNAEAKIQYLHVKENLFEHDGLFYCGFQFTVPEWLDGDFEWMHILAKTEANKDLSIQGMQWYIVPKSGRSEGFEYFRHDAVASYPRLKQRFPFTKNMFVQELDKNRLQAGKSYAIWFSFKDQNVCDIAFAMTIDSERGAKECGVLPLR